MFVDYTLRTFKIYLTIGNKLMAIDNFITVADPRVRHGADRLP